MQITVKVEFGEKVLGESPKVDCIPDTPAEIDYTATLNCSFEDPLVLDEISYKPVVCKCWNIKEENSYQLDNLVVLSNSHGLIHWISYFHSFQITYNFNYHPITCQTGLFYIQ